MLFRPGVTALSVGLLVFCAGCRVPPKPESPPALGTSVMHYVGSPLSGPTDQPLVDQRPEDVPAVDVTVVALDRPVSDLGAPLGSRAQLVVAQRGDAAVQPSARLTQGTRILDGPAAPGEWGDLARGRIPVSMTGVLPTAVTVAFELTDLAPLQDPVTGQAARRGVTLQLAQPAGDNTDRRLLVSLTVDDLVRPAPSPGGPPPASGPLSLESETALFDVPASDEEAALALFVPFRPTGTDTQTVAILAQVTAGTSDPAHSAAIARCQADVERSRADLGQRSPAAPVAARGAFTVSAALELMEVPGQRRAALVFLANQTGAALSRDLMLTAADALLERLSRAVKAKVPSDLSDHGAVGWGMEQAVLETLVGMGAGGDLPPEVTAVLTAHYGQAGRQPASLEELSRHMGSPGEFDDAVVAENMILLEDYSPGARVRAFEWLQARGRAPAGYEPLAPPRERRAALDRAQGTSPATAPAGGQP